MKKSACNVQALFMRRPVYESLLLTQHAGRMAGRGEGHSLARLVLVVR